MMIKKILAGLALTGVTGLGLAGTAQAAPVPNFAAGVNFHDRSGVTIGVGLGGQLRRAGYWATGYQWVQQTWIVGYDAWSRPIYRTGWVQQPYQYWVEYPTRHSYGPSAFLRFRIGR